MYTAQVWNRTDDVGDRTRSDILADYPGIPDDAVIVLLFGDDVLFQVQATDPSGPGLTWWPSEEVAMEWAEATAQALNDQPEVPIDPPEEEPYQAPVTRTEFNDLVAGFDWLTNYVITGES